MVGSSNREDKAARQTKGEFFHKQEIHIAAFNYMDPVFTINRQHMPDLRPDKVAWAIKSGSTGIVQYKQCQLI